LALGNPSRFNQGGNRPNTATIYIVADDGPAVTDDSKAISVTGKWFFDPADKTALVVDYKIEAHGVLALSASFGGCRDSRLSCPGGAFRRKSWRPQVAAEA
jgi:hypothetical protein